MEWARRVHQNRLVQTAREGANTDAAHLRDFGARSPARDARGRRPRHDHGLIDETLEMHERTLGREFKKAERKHPAAFQANGKAINEKLRLYAASEGVDRRQGDRRSTPSPRSRRS